MRSRWFNISCLLVATGLAGCGVNCWNTRMPSWNYGSALMQRRDAIHSDPFPDDSLGPDVGFRPPGYEIPRTDERRTKNNYTSTIIKRQNGAPVNPNIGPGAMYPNAVHVD